MVGRRNRSSWRLSFMVSLELAARGTGINTLVTVVVVVVRTEERLIESSSRTSGSGWFLDDDSLSPKVNIFILVG